MTRPSALHITDIEFLKLAVCSHMKGFQVGVFACLSVRLSVCPLRQDLDLNLECKPNRGERLTRPVSNVYMVLASYVCVCAGLACVACTSAKASAAARALCSKVLHVSDLVLNECL